MSSQNKDDAKATQEHKGPILATLDSLFSELGSCGRFQVIFVILAYSPLVPAVWAAMFMAFGNYDPGWTCLDPPLTISPSNLSDTEIGQQIYNSTVPNRSNIISYDLFSYVSTANAQYIADFISVNKSRIDFSERLDSTTDHGLSYSSNSTSTNATKCHRVMYCTRIHFTQGSSTVVTEWNLVCQNSWAPAVIISVQMVGLTVGSYASGQIGDLLGRKCAVFGNTALLCLTNIIAIFSVSWQMFAAIRFFIGFACGGILSTVLVFISEYVSQEWRGLLATFPFWNIAAGSFALAVMALKDWRYLHVATAVLAGMTTLSAFWLPESMRYLAVTGKLKRAQKAAKKIARLNRRPGPNTDVLEIIALQEKGDMKSRPKYTYIHLFHKKLRKGTLVIGMAWLFFSVTYYAVGFGITAFTGDFYLNFFLFSISAIPCRLIASVLAPKLGRKYGASLLVSASSLICFSVVAVQLLVPSESKGLPTTALAICANMMLEGAWGICSVLVVEINPTAVRTLCYGFVNAAARIGGIIAPYLIRKDSVPLYVPFVIMGTALALSVAGLMSLPETKNKPLEDNFLHRRQTSEVGPEFSNLVTESNQPVKNL